MVRHSTVLFRHQAIANSPLGIIYAWVGQSKTRKKMIEECLINCLLPYAYAETQPELAQEALQSSHRELQAWVERVQKDLTLQLISRESQSNSLSPLEEVVRELRLMRQAITSQPAAVVDELKLLRKSLGTLPIGNISSTVSVVGNISSTASLQMEKPNVVLTEEAIDSYVNGSTEFLAKKPTRKLVGFLLFITNRIFL